MLTLCPETQRLAFATALLDIFDRKSVVRRWDTAVAPGNQASQVVIFGIFVSLFEMSTIYYFVW